MQVALPTPTLPITHVSPARPSLGALGTVTTFSPLLLLTGCWGEAWPSSPLSTEPPCGGLPVTHTLCLPTGKCLRSPFTLATKHGGAAVKPPSPPPCASSPQPSVVALPLPPMRPPTGTASHGLGTAAIPVRPASTRGVGATIPGHPPSTHGEAPTVSASPRPREPLPPSLSQSPPARSPAPASQPVSSLPLPLGRCPHTREESAPGRPLSPAACGARVPEGAGRVWRKQDRGVRGVTRAGFGPPPFCPEDRNGDARSARKLRRAFSTGTEISFGSSSERRKDSGKPARRRRPHRPPAAATARRLRTRKSSSSAQGRRPRSQRGGRAPFEAQGRSFVPPPAAAGGPRWLRGLRVSPAVGGPECPPRRLSRPRPALRFAVPNLPARGTLRPVLQPHCVALRRGLCI